MQHKKTRSWNLLAGLNQALISLDLQITKFARRHARRVSLKLSRYFLENGQCELLDGLQLGSLRGGSHEKDGFASGCRVALSVLCN